MVTLYHHGNYSFMLCLCTKLQRQSAVCPSTSSRHSSQPICEAQPTGAWPYQRSQKFIALYCKLLTQGNPVYLLWHCPLFSSLPSSLQCSGMDHLRLCSTSSGNPHWTQGRCCESMFYIFWVLMYTLVLFVIFVPLPQLAWTVHHVWLMTYTPSCPVPLSCVAAWKGIIGIWILRCLCLQEQFHLFC